MREKLFKIEDSFQITGRGIVVTGELKPDSPVFKSGSAVVLVKPDGEEFVTEVVGIEHMKVIIINFLIRTKSEFCSKILF